MTSYQPRKRQRLNSEEIRDILNESDEQDDGSGDTVPRATDEDASDVEADGNIDFDEGSDSDDSDVSDDPPDEVLEQEFLAKDGTRWSSQPLQRRQTIQRNVIRDKGGPAHFTKNLSAKQIFKRILSDDMCSLILEETNRKAAKITESYNNSLSQNYRDPSNRPPLKTFCPVTAEELDAFFGVLLFAGVHRSNRESLLEMWATDNLPLYRATMTKNRMKEILRFIRFDNGETRDNRVLTDKAAAIRDIWEMLNKNLEKAYRAHESMTVDEQLFGYRGRTKFTQYMPSKPDKYGIKIFWVCDSTTSYPLMGKIYTGKPPDAQRQTNVGERIVLDLVSKYKGSGRNVTCDNFFTTLQLAQTLASWNLTVVGTVRKNKRFLPSCLQAHKDRQLFSTNFVFNRDATLCSYVPKKKKSVIMLSSMHTSPVVEDTQTAKPEIITYYNETKGGVDNMDKLVSEYTTKRKTSRWTLALFFNILDISGLAAFKIFSENNPQLSGTDKRRQFLKDLAKQLCIPNIECRMRNVHSYKHPIVKSAIDLVMGISSVVAPANPTSPGGGELVRDSSGRVSVKGSCYVCRQSNHRQRKTRKECSACQKPICDEHSSITTTCLPCTQNIL